MQKLIQTLIATGPIATDGAWGTELQARGLLHGEFPDAWNLSHPERVEEVARAYVEAGSQIILTNTFGANRIRLNECGLAGKVAEINRAGVELSRRATDGRALVFASIGPSGKLLINGDVTTEELRAVFVEQALALAGGGADALIIETMSDLEEAKLAIAAACDTGLPVVACMVFDSGKNKDRTMMGASPEEAAQTLAAAGADVIGANCGCGIADFSALSQRLCAATDRPIWLKPNAGLPQLAEGKVRYNTSPREFAAVAAKLVQSGVQFIGGCCGTNPQFIRALCHLIHKQTFTGDVPTLKP